MSKNKPQLIECPFFESFTDYGIRCEGFSRDSYVDQHFPSRSERGRWLTAYCVQGKLYKHCPMAKLLDEYHKNGGGDND